MQIQEKHNIIVESHPYYKDLNERLKQDFLCADFFPKGQTFSVTGWHSSYETSSETIDKIISWVITLIKQQNNLEWIPRYTFFCSQSWFIEYGIGDVSGSHVHSPRDFSFVYYVRCPKGSSPLVFTTTGKKIKAEEGKVVIFPANVYHHVPKNNCDGRIVLAGNIEHHP
jgi:hypothetical protein